VRLRPMFSFYGAKWRASVRYPAPSEKLIIEPFAGSASYAMLYHKNHDIWINDVDKTIYGVWKYLQNATRKDILDLPLDVINVDNWEGPRGAKDLIGFWFTKATPVPAKEKVGWARKGKYAAQYWSKNRRQRVANQVEIIRDWKITNLSYEGLKVPNQGATWFVDPPYSGPPGRAYKHNEIDFDFLASWCKSRPGQVIVCENSGADWLPFKSLGDFKTARNKKSSEVVWVKY
jgi:site-specific DNA-adenine methylase